MKMTRLLQIQQV
uniref:Uncharacterized protein n=1 Tax=Arundo donax TaxID=35708 RepID=A0A0A8Z4G9_ARUDO